MQRYETSGIDGLLDLRLSQVSHRRAPVDEVMALTERYRRCHSGWNVKPFYSWYRADGGPRSYRWVKDILPGAGLVERASGNQYPPVRRCRMQRAVYGNKPPVSR